MWWFAGACLGHLVLMILSHNWWYGLPLSRHAGSVIHLVHGLLILAFPPALGWAFGWHLQELPTPTSEFTYVQLATLYVLVCNAIGFFALPLNTLIRCLRRDPSLDKRSRVLDVAKH